MTEPELFYRLRTLDDTERYSYAEKGRICLEIKNTLSHQKRTDPDTGEPCSLSAWIRLAAPWSYSTCFAAMRDLEALKDVSPEALSQISESNIKILTQLSTAVRSQPVLLQAAKTKRFDEFIEHIKREHPDQHVESRKAFRVVLDETQSAEVEGAIEVSMGRGAMSRAEALTDICINYRADVLIEELQKETK